jgi:hypothetical protein
MPSSKVSLLAAALILFTIPALADSHVRIVRLSDVEGSVQIDRNTGQGFEKALMNMPITQGVKLKTAAGGRAEVEFENGTVLRLADNSSVDFDNLSLRSDGQRVSDVRVNDGTVYVNYKKKHGDDLRLNAGNGAINLDHDRDAHFRLQLDNGRANLAVFKGELQIAETNKTAKVKKGETLSFDVNGPSDGLLAKNISSFGADQWDSNRDEYLSQYASTFNHSQFPYEYGYSDLTYYGNFFNVAGYGTLWRPFGVSALWDPFGAGAWAYYPSFGYTWVSGYPWGWTPYRYGTWLYVPTYGWAWQPGVWNTWNTFPVVASAPTRWQRPLPPTNVGTLRPTVFVGHPTFTRPVREIGPGVPRPGYRPLPNASAMTNTQRPVRGTATRAPESMRRPAPMPRSAPTVAPSRPAPMPRSAPMPRMAPPPMPSSAPPAMRTGAGRPGR